MKKRKINYQLLYILMFSNYRTILPYEFVKLIGPSLVKKHINDERIMEGNLSKLSISLYYTLNRNKLHFQRTSLRNFPIKDSRKV